jgi:imidazolonepropionase-like amidohydrolase
MTSTLYRNCRIFDGHNAYLLEDAGVVVEGNRIRDIGKSALRNANALQIDCRGGVLMPGLIDCHFHAYSPSFDIYGLDRMPMSLLSQHAARLLEQALLRGFTTVRDAGGGDIGLAIAIEKGLIKGPRLFFSGKAISQTGGHGDIRPPERVEPCNCGYSGAMSTVADGVDGVRKAVREQLRKGATQIKIYMSGGVVSPACPIWMPQFSEEEVRVAVQEAATRRTYVMAHCHTDDRARACVQYGVRSIEHGTEITATTARLIADSPAYVVPTLSVIAVVHNHGKELGLSPASLDKAHGLYERALASLENCVRAGVKLGFGTDLLGDYHSRQGGEFQLRGDASKSIDVLRSATSINAEILQRPKELGCIAPGAFADMIVLRGDPMKDLSLFADSDKNIPLIVRGGEVIKNTLDEIA